MRFNCFGGKRKCIVSSDSWLILSNYSLPKHIKAPLFGLENFENDSVCVCVSISAMGCKLYIKIHTFEAIFMSAIML